MQCREARTLTSSGVKTAAEMWSFELPPRHEGGLLWRGLLESLIVGEIRKGIKNFRWHDKQRAKTLYPWLRELREVYSDRILPIDEAIADQ